MAIKKIAHLADIHIRKSTNRHHEYQEVFNEVVRSLRTEQPDRIVIVGDLFHDNNKIEGELLVLSSKFITELAKIAPVILTRGNHDILKSAPNRVDSVEALVTALSNPNVTYHNETGMFEDDNVVWCVWKHGERKNNPWDRAGLLHQNKIYIDLFHDPINGSQNPDGFEFNSKTYRSVLDFKGHFSFFGDIHKHQFLDLKETKAYCGSLIAQNFGEGDNQFHGYILWDISNGTHKDVAIKNKYAYSTIVVNRFTDFDSLNIKLPNPVPNNYLRVKWQTLPAIKNKDNEGKVVKHLNERFNPVYIKHISEFIEEDKIDIQENSIIDNITKREVLHTIITDYLTKIGVEQSIIQEVLTLDEEIESRITTEELTNIQWSIVKFGGKHFRNIRSINIDWRNKDGFYQITGENTAGKSSIIQLLSYILYGQTIETEKTKKFGDSRFVNNRINTNSCEGYIIVNCNGEYFGIKRSTTLEFNKKGELKGSPTVVNYYKLVSPDDDLNDDNDINKKIENEQERRGTQKKIEKIIGTYENFTRIILTTADTLNGILGTDSSVFIDSILKDSGLDMFDLRLTEFKAYRKKLIATDRINCKVDVEESAIAYLQKQNSECDSQLSILTSETTELQNNIKALEFTKETLLQKMNQIDPSIASMNVAQVTNEIAQHQKTIISLKAEEASLTQTISTLKETYDVNRLNSLLEKRETHRSDEYKLRTEINNLRVTVEQTISKQHRTNGDIELLKREGAAKKKEILDLKDSKHCPTCGQLKTEDSLNHILSTVKEKEVYMFGIVDKIKNKEKEKAQLQIELENQRNSIKGIEEEIANRSIAFEANLVEIGNLNNEKLEVERRNKLVDELKNLPVRFENVDLKIKVLEDRIERFNELKSKIEANDVIKVSVAEVNDDIAFIHQKIKQKAQLINKYNSDIIFNTRQIATKQELIERFKEQERQDSIMEIYEKCVHRDGIPTQILTNILLPKINISLSNLLESVDFDVWLDSVDLKLKMAYAQHPEAIIDCVGGSGKERTFSSISLKVALNEINSKSKPTIFMLDEVMGKLKGDSINQFLEFLSVIRNKVSKLIIIEQNHEVNPDWIIHAATDSNLVSTITLLEE